MNNLKFENEVLSKLFKDKNITDISFNGNDIYIQDNKKGRYKLNEPVNPKDIDDYIKQLTYESNKEFNNEEPILNLDYPGLRVSALHKSISPYGTTASLRISLPELKIKNEEELATKEIFNLLKVCIKSQSNILISGKTGSGKTELQKLLIKYINDTDKIVLIEDTLDTHLKEIYPKKDILSWKINEMTDKKIDFDDLIKASLRNNPDWILISEVRGSEAYSMLKSALSGHHIITTLHSNNSKNNIERLIHLCKEKYDLEQVLLGKMISDIFDLGIHVDYDISDKGIKRFIVDVVEYLGYDESGIKYNTIFKREIKIKKVGNEFEYVPTFFYGKISEKLFQKLLNNKCLNDDIIKFIDKEVIEKYEEN